MGRGPRAQLAWAWVCATQVRGRKAAAFHTSAVPKQKVEPSQPGAEAGFRQEVGPHTPRPWD